MKRRSIALCATLLLGTTSVAPIRVGVQINRTSFDLLDSVAIGITVDNTNASPVVLHFPLPTEYEIDVMRGDTVVWNSRSLSPLTAQFPMHGHTILPGASVLVTDEWNEIERDGTTSPSPGDYLVRVKLLEANSQPSASTHIRFIPPTPISAVDKLKVGEAITVGGSLDDTHGVLTDSTGSIALSRRLVSALANGLVVVRGFITLRADGKTRFITIQRWAAVEGGTKP